MGGEQLQNLFHEFWMWRLKESPEFATQIGVHDYDDKLDSYDLKAFQRRKETCEEFAQRGEAMIEFIKLDEDGFNLSIFLDELNTYIMGYNYKGFLWPINYMEGVQVDFERLIRWMVFEDEKDYENLISRYSALPKQIDEIILLLQEGVDLGMTNHHLSMEGVLEQLDHLQLPALESALFAPFRKFPHKIPPVTEEELYARGKNSYDNEVCPAFKKLRNFIANVYMKHLRPNIACGSLPNGAVLYQQCLNFHLTIDLNATQVHEIGLQEVARIEKEMQKIIIEMGSTSSLKEFREILINTNGFSHNSKQDLLQGFVDLVTNIIHPLIPSVIKSVPKMQLVVSPFPNSIPNGPACFYLAGSYDGSRPGTFYVNLSQYSHQAKNEMISLCLHEAEPGHHTQASYAIEQTKLAFRRFIEDRKYAESPSRFPIHTAYVEGWALYCETLGEDLGLYEDLHVRFGHYSQEIGRACRLVVDTGIHLLGWSHEAAVDFLKEHSAASETNIINELRRYITWPGQACAYKVGEMKIRDLRKVAEKSLGSDFDLKEFHDIILSHAGPLTLLEKEIWKYINNNSKSITPKRRSTT